MFGYRLSESRKGSSTFQNFKNLPSLQISRRIAYALTKRSRHFNTAYHNTVGRNIFGRVWPRCCDVLPHIKYRLKIKTITQAQGQHCCTNQAKRVERHATSRNVARKFWPSFDLGQQHPICRNSVATGAQHVASTVFRYVALTW